MFSHLPVQMSAEEDETDFDSTYSFVYKLWLMVDEHHVYDLRQLNEPAIQPKRRFRTVDGQQTPRTPSASFHGATQSSGHQSRAALSRSHAGAPSVRRVNFGESVRCRLIPADYRRRFRDRHRHQPAAQPQASGHLAVGSAAGWRAGRGPADVRRPSSSRRKKSSGRRPRTPRSSAASSRSSSASSRSSSTSSRSAPSTTRWQPKLRLPQVNTELYRWNRELRARIKENNQDHLLPADAKERV
ncbi:hypothetical protein M3Y99_01931400 [Aphelenchoides fujianensis]|nr:hypothetical protein M3Y99_01931400 [Aphelenchoides fujianensis]